MAKAKPASEGAIKLKPIKVGYVRLRIRGLSELIHHQWSEKAKEMMRLKKAGKKTKDREACVPENEYEAATYYTKDGKCGIPLTSIKAAILTAAHKDLGVEKTLVRKALFIMAPTKGEIVLPLEYTERRMEEDPVRVGAGSADLRYRPYYDSDWGVVLTFQLDLELLTVEDLVTLVNRAGFGVGVGERRPEKGGENGRFEVDPSCPVQAAASVAKLK